MMLTNSYIVVKDISEIFICMLLFFCVTLMSEEVKQWILGLELFM